ncbi:uncharacterized protein [Nicotiana sylvestris]|uniref:uncharacterized protein n=1 Tax=Nicotiana sylvestris TaxID=4096 RepID=UPI00388C8D7E
MASSNQNLKNGVFLSFRGEDTRKTCLGHLYYALKHRGIHTFKDDIRLERGKSIPPELVKAIEQSRFAIVVFSKNYATSAWCLDELAKIMKCKKELGQTVYDMDPSDHVVEDILGKLCQVISSIDNDLVGMESRVREVSSLLRMEAPNVCFIGIGGMGGIGKTTIASAVFGKYSCQFEDVCFCGGIGAIGGRTGAIGGGTGAISGGAATRAIALGGGAGVVEEDEWEIVTESPKEETGVWLSEPEESCGGVGFCTAPMKSNLLADSLLSRQKIARRRVLQKCKGHMDCNICKVFSSLLKVSLTITSVYEGMEIMRKRLRSMKVLIILDDVNQKGQLEIQHDSRRSRIWLPEDIEDLFTGNFEAEAVEGLWIPRNYIPKQVISYYNISEAFRRMKRLRSLEKLPSYVQMGSLTSLKLSCLPKLRELPETKGLHRLLTLELADCQSLEMLPKLFARKDGDLKLLEKLVVSGTAISRIPPSFAGLGELSFLSFPHWFGYREDANFLLPWSFRDLGCLSSLAHLDLTKTDFISFNESNNQSFHYLDITICEKLVLPKLPACIKELYAYDPLVLKSIPDFPTIQSCIQCHSLSILRIEVN